MSTIKVTRKTARLLRVFLDAHRFQAPVTGLMAMRAGVGAGSFYPLAERLEEAGWVRSEWEEPTVAADRPRRRFYYLTEDGVPRAEAAVRYDKERKSFWKQLRKLINDVTGDDT